MCAALTPIPFVDLVRRMRREVEVAGSIFDFPARKWHVPDPEMDLGATHFGRRAATPVGPAAGPHTQLAQNIVLAWLAGGRIMELKTVQVNDDLIISRPCIHAPNIGFNVEWSQELRVDESLEEYAKAVYLIEILKATRVFGLFEDRETFANSTDTVYDISVGYDLAGIRSERVTGFLQAMRRSRHLFDELRGRLGTDLAEFRDIDLPDGVSDCVTLSTFHGCPANEIEAIARYLLTDLGLHTVIKLNPTLFGYDRVREILVDRLGYGHFRLERDAFEADLRYEDALEMLRRLRSVASEAGSEIGAKFTNTLVVANEPSFFPTQSDPYMYVSGAPLHVLAMNLMQRFREDLGFEIPVSFSAGIDKVNFPSAVACGMLPVTTCTDLLRQGGYGRLPLYLKRLCSEMRRCEVKSREAYVLAACGHGAQAVRKALEAFHIEVPAGVIADSEPDRLPGVLRRIASDAGINPEEALRMATRIAGRLNGRTLVPSLTGDPRYHIDANRREPKGIDSVLGLYDCVNCDLCISACPNDAIFAYEARPVEAETLVLHLGASSPPRQTAGAGFVIRETHQLAVVEGACNECSNCEVYCPETGAPFRVKERVFVTRKDFSRDGAPDGFCRDDGRMLARVDGLELVFEPGADADRAVVEGPGFRLEVGLDPVRVLDCRVGHAPAPTLDTATLWRLKTVWESIYRSDVPNMVNPGDVPKGISPGDVPNMDNPIAGTRPEGAA